MFLSAIGRLETNPDLTGDLESLELLVSEVGEDSAVAGFGNKASGLAAASEVLDLESLPLF